MYKTIKNCKEMKTMTLNQTTKGGILIRKSDSINGYEYSSQSLNWWINNEIPFYISIGYKIYVNTQFFNPITKLFI